MQEKKSHSHQYFTHRLSSVNLCRYMCGVTASRMLMLHFIFLISWTLAQSDLITCVYILFTNRLRNNYAHVQYAAGCYTCIKSDGDMPPYSL